MGGGGGVESVGEGVTYPVHVLAHVPFAELKKSFEGFQLRRGQKGQKGNNPSSCSPLNFLRCFCFSVSGKGETFFTLVARKGCKVIYLP